MLEHPSTETGAISAAATLETERLVERFIADGSERAVVVRALRGRPIEISHNAHTPLPAASLMKLPIAVAAQRAESHFRGRKWPAGEIHDTRFPSVMAAFDSHTTLSWTDLIGLCLITSDNDAANLLLSELPDDSIQAVLDEAGCENTSVSSDFSDLSLDGLDRENPTSAADVARILALIHRSEPAISRKMTNNLRNRRIPRLLDPTLRVANKTGSLDRVCNDAALIYADQTDLVFVVMANSVGDMVSAEVSITRIAEALTRDLELGSP